MPTNEVQQYYIECLKKDLEEKVGRKIGTSSDFNFLYIQIKKTIVDSPSVSTLKRLWAYVHDNSSRSRSTLNSLSRFLGYADWRSYVVDLMRNRKVESGYIDAKTLLADTVEKGDIVEAAWNPDRRVRLVALGDNRFEVMESVNAKLKPGTTFTALMFAKGLPLMCTNVKEEGKQYDSYVAGKTSGLTSLRLVPLQIDKD